MIVVADLTIDQVVELHTPAKAQGKRLGRPRVRTTRHKLAGIEGLTVSEAAKRMGVSRTTAHRMMVRSSAERAGD